MFGIATLPPVVQLIGIINKRPAYRLALPINNKYIFTVYEKSLLSYEAWICVVTMSAVRIALSSESHLRKMSWESVTWVPVTLTVDRITLFRFGFGMRQGYALLIAEGPKSLRSKLQECCRFPQPVCFRNYDLKEQVFNCWWQMWSRFPWFPLFHFTISW